MRAAVAGPLRVLLVVLVVLVVASARTARANELSPYEKESLRRALAEVHGTLDPAPVGKVVEAIDVVALDVIEDRDPAPRFLNVFHATTRADTIRREALLRPGEVWSQERVDETVRDLQTFQQVSLVLAVPIRGSAPDRVRLLVVTKDTWSLRSQLEFKLGSGGLDLLRLEPTERNIAGTFDSALGRFELYPETITVGAGVFVPRIAGDRERVYFSSEANVVLSRSSGEPEGTFGGFAVFTPLVSAETPWVWHWLVRWENQYVRRYVDAKLATFDAPSTPDVETVPDALHTRSMTQSAGVVRSLGRAHKTDVMVGAEVNVRAYRGLDPTLYDARVVQDYEHARVPRSDDRAAPFVQARLYEDRFLRVHDVDLLGLLEDYRVGYDVSIRAYPVTRALGSTRDFVGFDAFAQYVLPLGDGFARASGNALLEVEKEDVPTAFVAADLGLVTPRFFAGRLLVDALAIGRPRNYLNLRSVIGGDTRLRGYPSGAFLGENLVVYNVELRSRPVEIFSCQIAGALFHDAGDAFDGNDVRARSSAGFGLRGVFPQLDRRAWRLDVAFPLVRTGGAGPFGFYIAYEQAFPMTVVTPAGPFPTQSFLDPLGGALGQ